MDVCISGAAKDPTSSELIEGLACPSEQEVGKYERSQASAQILALQALRGLLSAGLGIHRSKELHARSFLFEGAIVEDHGPDYGDNLEV